MLNKIVELGLKHVKATFSESHSTGFSNASRSASGAMVMIPNCYGSRETQERVRRCSYAASHAAAILRGLIWMLVTEQSSLVTHVQQYCDNGSEQPFGGCNAWAVLSHVFQTILQDPQLQQTYLLIDALDECNDALDGLLEFIAQSSSASSHIKWIVSCKSQLADDRESTSPDRKAGTESGTPHRVCRKGSRQLAHVSGWEAQDRLSRFPPGLDALYGQTLLQIRQSGHASLCHRILAVLSIVRQPLT
ncbi:hypothetical protein ASPZODRAFT_13405 [Penicilliopsis zonata CBS 506.65]|uniref:Nephrocystin 3-like N-terminal domain-containing protein n=1 Tax=Penicilliopsis zonata CBS 506.65 TaxID=1073090 RepID=A0A1L9SSZ4_9EURO|nr:hypothetical protein ASPZODRAFT_13405 [Penicilliopsis zonata CBS 506.65]OJJ50319.1 hypothetical protein ASPZODRAFT_13405 [Penicilliopsis zonata CBS 506.65]